MQSHQARRDPTPYPVLTLPPEITSEIFLCCLPETREFDVLNPKEAPLLLTHVCGAWRQIAIATPQLWTAFYIAEENGFFDDLGNVAETWFTRAGICELSVKFHGSVTDGTDFASLLPVLRRYERDVHSLELYVDVGDLVMIDPPLECVSLQKLTIGILIDSEELPSSSLPLELFDTDLPLLREVLLSAAALSFLALPWQQLTKFTGELYHARDCLEALRAMPDLIECAFAAWRDDARDSDEIFHHPNIQHFTVLGRLTFDANAASVDILGHVTLPALRTLEIKDVDDFNASTLDSFLLRSAAPLQKLVICPSEGDEVTEIILSDTFLALPLTELEIWRPSINEDNLPPLLDHLARDANALPWLRNLSFRDCDFWMPLGAVVDNAALLVTQRRHLAGCQLLRSFHLVARMRRDASSDTLTSEATDAFENLKESGMDIYIRVFHTSLFGAQLGPNLTPNFDRNLAKLDSKLGRDV
ncbi:hypothetical protein B0H16DRAFT_1895297 [Mycena metata]|uniref:F-box domain-containing protein n=1 Tax=Mycena metata TaxID=1033252 RepID=A0AAD7HNT6_9AGAR|nr:hypothetical protein B0H16DRAFT_1895297 [Mycena metata]